MGLINSRCTRSPEKKGCFFWLFVHFAKSSFKRSCGGFTCIVTIKNLKLFISKNLKILFQLKLNVIN